MAQQLDKPGHNVSRTRGSNFTDNAVEEIGASNNRLWSEAKIVDSSLNPISSSNPLYVTSTQPVPLHSDMEGKGKISVGTTPVELSFTSNTETIVITADKDNDAILYVGKSNVDSSGNNAITFLEAKDSISMDYDDSTNALYIVASAASQNVWVGTLY